MKQQGEPLAQSPPKNKKLKTDASLQHLYNELLMNNNIVSIVVEVYCSYKEDRVYNASTDPIQVFY